MVMRGCHAATRDNKTKHKTRERCHPNTVQTLSCLTYASYKATTGRSMHLLFSNKKGNDLSVNSKGFLIFLTSCCAVLSHFSHVRLFSTLWTVAHQGPLSTGFSWQEHWSGLPCPPPGALPDPGIEYESLKSPALAGKLFTTSATWEALSWH